MSIINLAPGFRPTLSAAMLWLAAHPSIPPLYHPLAIMAMNFPSAMPTVLSTMRWLLPHTFPVLATARSRPPTELAFRLDLVPPPLWHPICSLPRCFSSSLSPPPLHLWRFKSLATMPGTSPPTRVHPARAEKKGFPYTLCRRNDRHP